MPAARYWRVSLTPQVRNGALEVSLVHLYTLATRVDAAATLTAGVAPTSGAVADLQDASLATGALWASVVKSVVLQWDFGGSPTDVTGLALGSADTAGSFPRHATLEWSTNATAWTPVDNSVDRGVTDYKYLIWPGGRTLSGTYHVSEWSRVNASRSDFAGAFSQTISYFENFSRYDTGVTDGSPRYFLARVGRRSGIRQFEVKRTIGVGSVVSVGVRTGSSIDGRAGRSSEDFVYQNDGVKATGAAYTPAYGATWSATSDVIGVVVNFTTGTITFYKNGVSQGVAYTNAALVDTVAYPITSLITSSPDNGFKLECETFTYPIAGATPWGGNTYPSIEAVAPEAALADTTRSGHLFTPAGYQGMATVPIAMNPRNYQYNNWGGQVYGTVKIDGTPTDAPVRRRVRIYRDIDGRLVQQQWSNATTGAYSFQYLETDHRYTVVSDDYTASFRAVVADKIVPEAMP